MKSVWYEETGHFLAAIKLNCTLFEHEHLGEPTLYTTKKQGENELKTFSLCVYKWGTQVCEGLIHTKMSNTEQNVPLT